MRKCTLYSLVLVLSCMACVRFPCPLFFLPVVTAVCAGAPPQIWKVRRATGMHVGWRGLTFPRLQEENATTDDSHLPMSAASANSHVAKDKARHGRRSNGVRQSREGKYADSCVASRKGAASDDDKRPAGFEEKAGGEARANERGWSAAAAAETMEYDRIAIAYLSLLLLPIVVGFSAKKLVLDEHAGWYSWALQSLTVSRNAAQRRPTAVRWPARDLLFCQLWQQE